MFYNAVNNQLNISNATMDYIRFGTGKKNLIFIPGLGDGLRTVKGTALPFAFMYRAFAKDYTVWVFSRKSPLEPDCTTRTMAADISKAMDLLHIEKAHIIGVSQGGMIAQWLSIDYPQKVDKLVLAVTMSRQNGTVQQVINSWIDMAQAGDFRTLTIDNFEKSYTDRYLKKYRPFYPLIVPFMKPADPGRFILQARSCLTHHSHDDLHRITRPVLIICAEQDRIVTAQRSYDMAGQICGSKLISFPEYGHAVYEEAGSFNKAIIDFLR